MHVLYTAENYIEISWVPTLKNPIKQTEDTLFHYIKLSFLWANECFLNTSYWYLFFKTDISTIALLA